MNKTIQDIILKWIGERDEPYMRVDDLLERGEINGRNALILELRAKAPELAKEIGRAIWTDMLEKTEGWYGRSEAMVNDYFKNQLTQE